MIFKIQQTSPVDFSKTENLTREAFWDLYSPGCNEHLILHQLRKSTNYIPELDLIAVSKGKIVGHIISTKATVIGENKSAQDVLCVGPISVLPSYQRQGIGSELMKYSRSAAAELGYPGMILFGSPDYYNRFGFKNAAEFKITTRDGNNFSAFMVLELRENDLFNVKGKFLEAAEFQTDRIVLNEFDRKFPFKEKGKPKIAISKVGI